MLGEEIEWTGKVAQRARAVLDWLIDGLLQRGGAEAVTEAWGLHPSEVA